MQSCNRRQLYRVGSSDLLGLIDDGHDSSRTDEYMCIVAAKIHRASLSALIDELVLRAQLEVERLTKA